MRLADALEWGGKIVSGSEAVDATGKPFSGHSGGSFHVWIGCS